MILIHHPLRQRARRRRAPLAAVVAIAVAAVAVVGPWSPADEAGAARRTSSTVIADQADRAVVALERWQTTRRPADYVRYIQRRDETARLTGTDMDVDVAGLRIAWANAPLEKQHAVLAAMTQLGVPWRYAASEPGVGFDCSGLTSWAFDQVGASLPRISGDQIDAAVSTDDGDAEPGDLVYWPGHIGIYLGADAYVHSPNSGNVVEVARLPDRSLTFGDAVAEALGSNGRQPPSALDDASSVVGSLVDRAVSVAK